MSHYNVGHVVHDNLKGREEMFNDTPMQQTRNGDDFLSSSFHPRCFEHKYLVYGKANAR
jgi:hypothetical protein